MVVGERGRVGLLTGGTFVGMAAKSVVFWAVKCKAWTNHVICCDMLWQKAYRIDMKISNSHFSSRPLQSRGWLGGRLAIEGFAVQ
jgi:hypothetical protein